MHDLARLSQYWSYTSSFCSLWPLPTSVSCISWSIILDLLSVDHNTMRQTSEKPQGDGGNGLSVLCRSSKSARSRTTEKRAGESKYPASYAYSGTMLGARPNPTSYQPELAKFYEKEVFVCEGDGRPPWCTICMNWKPDRAHHCREIARCVKKMDHFCPW